MPIALVLMFILFIANSGSHSADSARTNPRLPNLSGAGCINISLTATCSTSVLLLPGHVDFALAIRAAARVFVNIEFELIGGDVQSRLFRHPIDYFFEDWLQEFLVKAVYRHRPDKTIQAILRNANLSTTMNAYVKSVPADATAVMKAFEDLCNQHATAAGEVKSAVM